MSNARRSMFVDEMPCYETIKCEGPVQFMRGAVCHRISHNPARARGGLETTRSPTRIDEQVFHGGKANNGRGIGSNINDTCPSSQHLGTREYREQFQCSRQ